MQPASGRWGGPESQLDGTEGPAGPCPPLRLGDSAFALPLLFQAAPGLLAASHVTWPSALRHLPPPPLSGELGLLSGRCDVSGTRPLTPPHQTLPQSSRSCLAEPGAGDPSTRHQPHLPHWPHAHPPAIVSLCPAEPTASVQPLALCPLPAFRGSWYPPLLPASFTPNIRPSALPRVS